MTQTCIFIDWGTTRARAYLLDGAGKRLETRQSDLGILNLGARGFPDAFAELTRGWRDGPGERPSVLMSGMVGSRQGWAEAPYVFCPARPRDLAQNVMAAPGMEDVWIVPGVCLPPDGPRRDVIRGEEVQVFGALELAEQATATLCLPGTHSKWVRAEEGKLARFSTAMTGEVYRVMGEHSILGALMSGDGEDREAFAKGIEISAQDGGLLHHLFSVRADGLFGALAGECMASYLSGLLIGHEIRPMAQAYVQDEGAILLVGAGALTGLYGQAFDLLGLGFKNIEGADATVAGLTALRNSLRRDAGLRG